MNIYKSILDTTIIFLIGLTFVIGIGLVLDFIEQKLNKYLYHSIGYFGYLLTSIGTVIHELSHLLFVILLRMKPTEIKLLRPYSGYKDGCLGYVSYEYNKRNWAHKCGLLFVGIAPIIGGTLTIFVILKFIFPETFSLISEAIQPIYTSNNINLVSFFTGQLKLGLDVASSLLQIDSIKKFIGVFLIFSITTHMSLSPADLNSAKKSIIYILVIFVVIGLTLNVFGLYVSDFVYVFKKLAIYVLLFCNVAIIFSLISLLISYLLYKIFSFIKG